MSFQDAKYQYLACCTTHNINGVAILYADKITNSMKAAINETKHRCEKQMKFNEEHGIVLQQIKKQVKDIKTACTTKKT